MIYPVRGPWKGIEERESYQTDQHCSLAINVDFSRGYIEPREGTKVVGTPAAYVTHAQIAVLDRPAGSPYILLVGPSQSRGWRIYCSILTLNGALVANVDLTTTLGEPADQHFQCSINRVILVNPDTLSPNFVGLITTPKGSFIWNPHVDPTTVRRPVMTGVSKDALQELTDIPYYWITEPRGRICVQHFERLFYAGFNRQEEITLSQGLPATQSYMPESWVTGAERDHFTIGPHVIVYSDTNDPLGIGAQGMFRLPNTSERVTGLRSFKENLIIFSDRAIYTGVGNPEDIGGGMQIHKVVDGVACVAPNAIEEAGGVLLFVAADGIYTFDGSSATKISAPIDSMWNGQQSTNSTIKDGGRGVLYEYGYPWSISKRESRFATSCHVRKKNQVWFSIPTIGKGKDDGPLVRAPMCTIVFDYANSAFSLYTDGGKGSSGYASADVPLMFDGTTYTGADGLERVFLARGGLREEVGYNLRSTALTEYGGYATDYWFWQDVTPPVQTGFPFLFAWVSARHMKENEETISFRRPRIKMLARRKGTAPATYYLDGEESAFDKKLNGVTNTDRQQASGNIIMHPDTGNDYFLGTGRLGTMILGQRAWFTSRIDPTSVASKWCRFGVTEWSTATAWPESRSICIESYSLEIPDVARGLR